MMLIKTSEPNRQIERMLEKSARRRRLAHRQHRDRNALRAVATAISVVDDVMQGMTASNQVLHHAKPHALPIKPRQCLSSSRSQRDVHSVTRWNVFGDMFL
ncbi:MAG: hypothetical protein WBR29_12635 [Gammaproteobacteria bacterium]